ncbi:class I SAM-dependent methyltransferase [Oceanirhabdus seepicola]|uniref:Class I SAM-dependent methyltransferase n=1 Tax=Oceanirhabdus seepicola TaxID=2828781 RepID=A0A9J6NVM5_9CLOT|nr:class I SAM-dependent methyltransferase [Oceanirhabdus seepicola]MCM1988514.1 class I SAM-dependent methyltransferase [Oceanirhabdus seepicola]
MDNIVRYYDRYNEDIRLIKDRAHQIEFITTTKYLDEFMKKGMNVLDLGAGTGRYSIHMASNGVDVTAVDIVPKHVEEIRNKANEKNVELKAVVGNGKDLREFEENSFDAVICLGPLYHISDNEGRARCIEECLRVLKPNGVFMAAYINRYAVFANMIGRDKNNINDQGLINIYKTGREFGNEKDVFYFSSYSEIEGIMDKLKVNKEKHITTDGMMSTLATKINEFKDDEFEKWMEYHLLTCEESSLVGCGLHGLYIGKL